MFLHRSSSLPTILPFPSPPPLSPPPLFPPPPPPSWTYSIAPGVHRQRVPILCVSLSSSAYDFCIFSLNLSVPFRSPFSFLSVSVFTSLSLSHSLPLSLFLSLSVSLSLCFSLSLSVLYLQCLKFLKQKISIASKMHPNDPAALKNGSFVSSREMWNFINELGISKVGLGCV